LTTNLDRLGTHFGGRRVRDVRRLVEHLFAQPEPGPALCPDSCPGIPHQIISLLRAASGRLRTVECSAGRFGFKFCVPGARAAEMPGFFRWLFISAPLQRGRAGSPPEIVAE